MIARIVNIKVPEPRIQETKEIWKKQWAPLIVAQPGCLTHLLLQHREDPSQFISLSLWASQHVVDEYLASPARAQIRNSTRGNLEAIQVDIQLYDIVH